jgi:branched-subunit amino acid transport protein
VINISKQTSTSSGIGIGAVIAIILSWTTNHSILWCILHGIFSWFYVIYWVIQYK